MQPRLMAFNFQQTPLKEFIIKYSPDLLTQMELAVLCYSKKIKKRLKGKKKNILMRIRKILKVEQSLEQIQIKVIFYTFTMKNSEL